MNDLYLFPGRHKSPHPQGWWGVVGVRLLCYQKGASRHLPQPVPEPGSAGLLGNRLIKPTAVFQMQNHDSLWPLLRHKSSLSAASPDPPSASSAQLEQLHGSTMGGNRDSFQGTEATCFQKCHCWAETNWLTTAFKSEWGSAKLGREGNLLMEMSNPQMSSLCSSPTNCPAYIPRGTWVPCPQNPGLVTREML